MEIDLEQYIDALSNTISLVGVDETQPGKRVAFLAREWAKILVTKGRNSPSIIGQALFTIVVSLQHVCIKILIIKLTG